MSDLNNPQEAVLKTLIYSDIFNYPLKEEEIYSFLISDNPSSQEEVVNALDDLKRRTLIIEKEGLFLLPGREDNCVLRKKRNKYSDQKLIKAKKLAWLFRLIPWAQLVAVTGAVAAGNAEEESDIDLMVIAQKGRVWLTRFLVLGLLKVLGLRVDLKRGSVKDKFCLNLFINDDQLEFPKKSLYTANEIARIKPIFKRSGFYQKFLDVNQWISQFLPNFFETFKKESLVSSGVLDFLEKKVRDWQVKKIRWNFPQTSGLTDDELLSFHPNDISQRILEEFQKRV